MMSSTSFKAVSSCLLYSFMSVSMVLVNKSLVSSYNDLIDGNLNFFIVVFQAIVATTTVSICNKLEVVEYPPFDISTAKKWAPVNILFCLMLYTSMVSLQHNSVPIMTIFKNFGNIFIAAGDYFFFDSKIDCLIMTSFVIMVFGAVFAAGNDINMTLRGLLWMIANCLSTAGYVLYMKFATKTIELTKFGMVFYNNLLCFIFLLPVILLNGEMHLFLETNAIHTFDYGWKMIFAGLVGFFLNFASLNCVANTSPTTYAVVGSLNRIPLILLGWYLFHTHISAGTWIFIAISLIGGFLYSYAQIRSKASPTTTNSAKNDEFMSLLGSYTTSCHISRKMYVILGGLLLLFISLFNLLALPHLGPDIGSNYCDYEKVVVNWAVSNPAESHNRFVYYQEIGKAINSHENVSVCQGSIISCFNETRLKGQKTGNDMTFVPILDHQTFVSGGPEHLAKIATKVSMELDQILSYYDDEETTLSGLPCITITALVNKVYNPDIGEKIKAFMNPFDKFKSIPTFKLIGTTWSPHAADYSHDVDMPMHFVPFGVDNTHFNLTSRFVPWEQRSCDIFIRWDSNPEKYELRSEIDHLLIWNRTEDVSDVNVSAPTHFLGDAEYLTEIANCKMSATTIGMPSRVDLFGTRYYEIMASGTTLLLAQTPESKEAQDAQKELGMIDGTTIVEFSDEDELLEKIRYYKENTEEAYTIIRNAQQATKNNTWIDRGQKTIDFILEQSTCYNTQNDTKTTYPY